MSRDRWWTAILLSAAACGGGSSAPPDAEPTATDAPIADAPGPPDARIDAAPIEYLEIFVEHRCCENEGWMIGGAPIVIHNADGTLHSVVNTNPIGVAAAVIEPGASVTAIYPELSSYREIVTVIGVDPGDHIRLGERFAAFDQLEAVGTVVWTPQGDATELLFNAGCGFDWAVGANTGGATIAVYEGCGTPTTDIMVTVMNGTTPLRYAFIEDHVLVDNENVPLPPYVAVPPFSLDLTGIPSTVTSVYAAAVPHVGRFTSRRLEATGTPTDGAFSVSGLMPTGIGVTLDVRMTRPTSTGEQVYYDWWPPETASVDLAVPATLPWLDDVDVNPSTRTISWSQTLGAGYDVQVAELRYGADDDSHGYRWFLIAPPGATFQWPELPEPYSAYEPSDPVSVRLRFIDFLGIDTYDEVRALPEWEIVTATDHLSANTRTAMESVSAPLPPE